VSSPRVLLVDDEAMVLSSLGRSLRGLPCELVLEDDPLRALERLLRESIAVVVSDQHMPKLCGTALLTRARVEAPFAERLLMSGDLDSETTLSAVNSAGVSYLIAKPWDPENLRGAVSRALARHFVRVAVRAFPAALGGLLAAESEVELISKALRHFRQESADEEELSGSEEAARRFLEDRSFPFPELSAQPAELKATLVDLLETALGSFRQARALRSRARRDALTGAFNRSHLETLLESTLLEGPGPVSLVMVDVDHFKQINDTWGHGRGDEVLREVAGVLSSSSRSSDFVCRFGGDEFVVVLPGTSASGAEIYTDRVRRALGSTSAGVTLSLGIAQHLPGELPESLMSAVDGALYESKRLGRDRASVAQRNAGVETP